MALLSKDNYQRLGCDMKLSKNYDTSVKIPILFNLEPIATVNQLVCRNLGTDVSGKSCSKETCRY